MRRDRLLLLLLAASALGPAGWALVAPAAFHADFPGAGLRWVAPLGPYDEHLVRDVGAFFLALSVLTVLAARSLQKELVRATAWTWLVFQLPHLAVHLHLADQADTSTVLQVGTLLLQLALPIALLAGGRRSRATARQAGTDPPPTLVG